MHLQQQRVVAHVGGHRPGGVDGDLEQPDAGIRYEPEGRLQADDAAMARRNADRAGLVAADRHVDVARRHQRGAARRRAAGGVAALARIVHGTGRAGVAAARHAVIFTHRLAGDLAAGIENALNDGGVDIGHIAFQHLGADHHRDTGEAHIVLERDAAAGELAAGPALDRRLHVPGAVGVFRGGRPVHRTARVPHRRQLIGCPVEGGIGVGERRDDLLDGREISIARCHAERLRGSRRSVMLGFSNMVVLAGG